MFLNCYPAGKYGMEAQAKRLGREHLYLPGSFSYEEIENQLKQLTDMLGLPELTEEELHMSVRPVRKSLQRQRI